MARPPKLGKPINARIDSGGGWVDDGNGGVYVDYQCYNRYTRRRGLAQMPLASSTSQKTAVMVQLHQPVWGIRIDYTLAKEAAMPKIPNFELSDPDLFLLQDSVEPHIVRLIGQGGVLRYRVSGTYYYAATTAGPNGFAFPAPPYIKPSIVRGVKIGPGDFADITKVGTASTPNIKAPRG